MSPRSPSAYFLSAFLHTFVVAVLLLMAFMARKKPQEQPHIFELVAGEGDNFAATEAPAAAVPDAPKIELPAIKTPPVPKAPPPEPVVQPPPQPAPKVVVQPVPTPPKIEPKAQPAPAPKKVPDPPKQVAQAPKMTKAEFDKLNPQKATPAPKAPTPIRTQKIDAEGIAKGVTAGSPKVSAGAGGKALTRAESDMLDAYAALIRQRVAAALKDAGLADHLETRVEFRVSATGVLSNSRVISSSGDSAFDQAVLAAFRSIRPIGPPPTNQAHVFSLSVRVTGG